MKRQISWIDRNLNIEETIYIDSQIHKSQMNRLAQK